MLPAPTHAPRPAPSSSVSASAMSVAGDGGGHRPGEAPAGVGVRESGERPRVLVVDDAPDVTEMISVLLRYAGYDVVTVFSGSQALDAAGASAFDVIVSDIGMPGMNGYELAERLRASDMHRQTPMIALTGFSMYDDRDRALAAGFNAFLTNPVPPSELLSLVERLRG